ncbi:MAG TPA: ATP-grasp domain-containing protein [Candidatus Saccharimonadales bacterium]|nr:ATP-grasp domain-containing protein [Candidatus Saccharimonadales bacterium]
MQKDIVLSVDVVEPGLVNAVKLLSKELGRPLTGVVLVHKGFVDYPGRPVDKTGLFKEIVVDFDDPDALQRAVQPFMDRILLVTTRYEQAIHNLRQLIPFLPYLSAPTETSLAWSTEKPLMRDRLKAYDPDLVPKYKRIEEKDMANWQEITKGLTFPVIVKPGSLWSSFLVTRCDNEKGLGECLKATLAIINGVYKRQRRANKPAVLVEEMMQGDMYSTDAYVSQDGTTHCLPIVKVITAASLGLPGFYGHSCILPTGLTEAETEGALRAAKASVRALHLRSTTVHIEMFHTANGWKIIELGARIGGRREELYREAFNIEHHYNDLANRAGMELKIPTKLIRYARAEDFYADEEGTVEAVEGLDEARKLESIVSLNVHVKPGDEALFADKGGGVLIDAILSNADEKKLDADVAELRKVIRFKIKAAPVR